MSELHQLVEFAGEIETSTSAPATRQIPPPRRMEGRSLTRCPCCGATSDTTKPIVDLNTNCVSWGDMAPVKLKPREAEILKIVLDGYPFVVASERIMARLWGACDGGTYGVLKTMICLLRKKTAPLGIRIENVHSVGYKAVLA